MHLSAPQHELARELARVSAAADVVGRARTHDGVLTAAAHELCPLLEATGCVISRLDGNVIREAARSWRGGDSAAARFDGYGYLLDDYPLTRAVVETGRPIAVSLSDDAVERNEAFVLREIGMQAVLMLPFERAGRPWGLVEIYDARPRRFHDGDTALAGLFVRQTAGIILQLEQTEAVERLYRETLASLVNALEVKDSYTSDHTHEVVELAVSVADELGLDTGTRKNIELGALLHDIGKIRVPGSVLNKPGPLDDEEWEMMRRHTEAGEAILAPIESLAAVLPIVRSSHERWDGRGYPDALAAETIPLGARVVSVCDAYRAMIEPRPYRAPRTPAEARSELQQNGGGQFDPACVEALLAVLDRRSGHERAIRLHRPAHAA